MMDHGIDHDIRRQLDRIEARMNRIEHDIHNLLRFTKQEKGLIMASKATDERAIAAITANTNATKAATAALQGYAQSTADLTQKLKEALDNADNADDPAVAAAVTALEQNNADLMNAVPAVAAAVTAGTPSAEPGA